MWTFSLFSISPSLPSSSNLFFDQSLIGSWDNRIKVSVVRTSKTSSKPHYPCHKSGKFDNLKLCFFFFFSSSFFVFVLFNNFLIVFVLFLFSITKQKKKTKHSTHPVSAFVFRTDDPARILRLCQTCLGCQWTSTDLQNRTHSECLRIAYIRHIDYW